MSIILLSGRRQEITCMDDDHTPHTSTHTAQTHTHDTRTTPKRCWPGDDSVPAQIGAFSGESPSLVWVDDLCLCVLCRLHACHPYKRFLVFLRLKKNDDTYTGLLLKIGISRNSPSSSVFEMLFPFSDQKSCQKEIRSLKHLKMIDFGGF